jgi:hypothetical protein
MINAGASQSLIKIEAVEIAKIPIGRSINREPMAYNLYQLEPLFKSSLFSSTGGERALPTSSFFNHR